LSGLFRSYLRIPMSNRFLELNPLLLDSDDGTFAGGADGDLGLFEPLLGGSSIFAAVRLNCIS
jgi:hypothetical protein